MKPLSKISLLIAGFSVIVISATRFVLGAWTPVLYGFLAVFLISLFVSLVLDYKLYLDFLSVKSAKKGLSLGWSLLLLFVFLVAISYLGKRYNKTFDLTSEKLNSLSEQSKNALETLDDSLIFYIFYKGDKQNDQTRLVQLGLKANLDFYRETNSKVKIQILDTNKNPLKAEKYLASQSDREREDLFLFVSYKDKKIRVDAPFQEEDLTSAVIKSQKREFKKILFLTGHEERELNSSASGGLQILNQSLKDSGFTIIEWNFINQGTPKTKPVLIASLGPKKNFLPEEKAWLKSYLKEGGRLILALDPKDKHGLEDFLLEYGIAYEDNYILSQLSAMYGANLMTAFGPVFDSNHPITKKFSKQKTVLFEKASALKVLSEKSDHFQISSLVKTDPRSISLKNLADPKKMLNQVFSNPKNLRSFPVALSVKPKDSSPTVKETEKDPKKKTEFELVLFGDSDFLTNRYINAGSNKDLILNTFVALSGEEELVSIRPKQPKGTKITLNRYQQMSLVLIYVVFPLIFLISGLVLWYRKRSA